MQLLLACPYFFQWWSHILFGDTFSSENLVFCQNDIKWLKISQISDNWIVARRRTYILIRYKGILVHGSVAMIKINGGLEN